MKKQLPVIAVAGLLILASCTEDESSSNDGSDQTTETSEQTPIAATTVFENVVINGGTKNEGDPPTPNEGISLDVSSSSSTAFLGEGFEIDINSDGSVVGAYLIFKSTDGTAADGYYDVDLAANNQNQTSRKSKETLKGLGRSARNETVTTLDVDFNANLPPGTFCTDICVYDSEGNISAPQEVCVTVESWGGFSNLVADWSFTKQEVTYNGETEVSEIGVEDCETYTSNCSGSGTVEITECSQINHATLSLKASGTYTLVSRETSNEIDYNATREQCALVLAEEKVYTYQSAGSWAYVSAENRLTLIEYEWSEVDGNEMDSGIYEAGNAEVLFNGTAMITDDQLVYTLSEEDGNDESAILYFER